MPEYEIEELEPEIDLKDLFFHLLYRWRSILLVALVCMVGLGFWQNNKIDSVHAKGEKTAEEEAWELEVQAYYNSLENARNSIAANTQQIQEQQEYLKNSIYIHLNAENEWVTRAVWYLQSTPEALVAVPEGSQIDPVSYALSAYQNLATSDIPEEDLERLFGTAKWEYISEVLDISTNAPANTVTMTAYISSEERAKEILNYFETRMTEVCEPQAQKISPHTRTLVSTQVQQETNRGTREYNGQKLTRAAEIKARQTEIETCQKQIATAQTTLNQLIRDEEPAAPGKHVIRYAAIGLIMGGVVMVILYAAMYLLGGKVHTGEDLTLTFRTGLYAALPHSRARRPGKGLDGLLEKWEFGRAERDSGKVYDSACALMRRQIPEDHLLLIGTLSAEKLQGVAEELRKRLPDGTRVATAPNFLRNAGAVEQAGEADALVLVEEKEVSRMAEMQRMRDMLQISGAPLKGCILL